ncbi:adenylate/guanylate cyclase domain-containing protein [Microvirga lotononidis]|uniref:Putative integral membrane protein n=1 Tax=Microvirga lotononidis TaxID=864069 RepID=I4YWL7_9HYPH|nr:adenylate/guanylate cyclase domain-containing protein [Microvirga lotononidis]EIM28359.1 putative integral membrane protein [Microvirga lotononidis]WQO27556.1 adenylate/guanylate cyclase domain-containing protein [Microvirga lotononidis]
MSGSDKSRVQRRLAAIVAADVVGFSMLMGENEEGTLSRIRSLRQDMIEPKAMEHHGRVVKTTGDGFLLEFSSPLEAVQFAVEVREVLASRISDIPDRSLQLRVGINLGDVLVEDDGDIFGDSVNIAARLEQLAQPGAICLSAKVYEEIRDKLPYRFQDQGEQLVKNIAKPVRVYSLFDDNLATRHRSLTVPDRPSIAVLPFDYMSENPDGEFLADGLSEDIIAALSRIRSFFVIARNSTFTYKGRAVNVQQVSRELGIRYVLEGSVRRSRDKVRITAQLIDAATGAHLWADRYDGTVEDIFDLQDRITTNVVGAIQPSIRAAEIERARRKRPDSLNAYDLVMQALPYVWSLDAASNQAASNLLDAAMQLDPTYPLALSLASWCSGQRVIYNWSQEPERDRLDALEKARAAADLDSDDPFVLTVLGAAHTITREFNTALFLLEQALALDPNSAWAWNRSGWLRTFQDDPETGIEHFERAIRLSPRDPTIFNSYAGIGDAHFVAGRYADAVKWLEKARVAHPKATWINRFLAASYALIGQRQEAERCVQRLLPIYPDLTVTAVRTGPPFAKEVIDRLCEGLRQAGLPE